eukprot:COSAG02_NODE_5687_length_4126_cov_2.973429_2_plen_428_part_00
MAINLYRQIAKTSAPSTARLRRRQAVPCSAIYGDLHAQNQVGGRREPAPSTKRWRCVDRVELLQRVSSSSFGYGVFEREILLMQLPRAEMATLPGFDEILRETWIDHGSRAGHRPISNGQRALCFVNGSFVAAAPVVGRSSDVVDASAINAALDRGHTLISHAVQLWSPGTAELCLQLSRALGRITNANLYCCGAGLQAALAPHNDAQCTFIWQLEGSKRWHMWLREPAMLPVDDRRVFGKHQDRQLELSLLGQPDVTLLLHPGDVLYLPRGTIHATDTTTGAIKAGSPSVHLTLGVDSWSVEDFTTGRRLPALTIPEVLRRVLLRSQKFSTALQQQKLLLQDDIEDLLRDINFRRSMPAGEQNKCATWAKTVRNALHELSHVNNLSSTNLSDDETNAFVREILAEYTTELEAWRAAMVTLAAGNDG